MTNETTLAAARRLADAGHKPLALNFANGIHPGGGFLNGARAQEEMICRSSARFVTLQGDPMYAAHARRPLPDSSDWAIYSPDVPVFRQDDGTELDQPWLSSFITCAAPYAPRLGQRSGDLLQQRIQRVLAIGQAYGYKTLVLGARDAAPSAMTRGARRWISATPLRTPSRVPSPTSCSRSRTGGRSADI